MKLPGNLKWLLILVITVTSCEPKASDIENPDSRNFMYMGRTDHRPDGSVALISSAASVSIHLGGDTCTAYLKNEAPAGQYNFVVFELDGEYLGRYRLDGDSVTGFPFNLPAGKKDHVLNIYKATEASNGNVLFAGISGEVLKPLKSASDQVIEFIGNSITCGMGVDSEEIPCGTGPWYGQHNAYWSYGSILSRRLHTGVILSSVSGFGVYRNWNTGGPALPEVYKNTYLNSPYQGTWGFPLPAPDVVSICLGTNDLSGGDGVNYREPFSEEQFTGQFIAFIHTLYIYYPDTKIALLSSPVLSGEKRAILESCLVKIQQYYAGLPHPKNISLYFFDRTFASGCTGHPDKNDQIRMAELLLPFFSGLL